MSGRKQAIAIWEGLVDQVFDSLEGGEDTIVVPVFGTSMMYRRSQGLLNHFLGGGIVVWPECERHEEHVAVVSEDEDIFQLREMLKDLVAETPRDVFVHFRFKDMYDKYSPLVDAMAGMAFSLMEQGYERLENEGVVAGTAANSGRIYIGTPTVAEFDSFLDDFDILSLCDMYISDNFQDRAGHPLALEIRQIGMMLMANVLVDGLAAFTYCLRNKNGEDVEGEEEATIDIIEPMLNWGVFNSYHTSSWQLWAAMKNLDCDAVIDCPEEYSRDIRDTMREVLDKCEKIHTALKLFLAGVNDSEISATWEGRIQNKRKQLRLK